MKMRMEEKGFLFFLPSRSPSGHGLIFPRREREGRKREADEWMREANGSWHELLGDYMGVS